MSRSPGTGDLTRCQPERRFERNLAGRLSQETNLQRQIEVVSEVGIY